MNEVVDARDLFGNYRLVVAPHSRKTERGEWLVHFSKKIGKPIGYVAMRLEGVPTEDLWAFDKQCESYKGPYTKAWYGALKLRDS